MPLTQGRALVLDAAGGGPDACTLIATLADGVVLDRIERPGRGGAAHLAPDCARLLAQAGWDVPDRVVVTLGPGSFTGLRASISLATGLGLGCDCTVIGVSSGAALRQEAGAEAIAVLHARPGRVFVDWPDGRLDAWTPEALAERLPPGTLLVGDAASLVPGTWSIGASSPGPVAILAAAETARDLPLLPLYVDPPEARLPAGGLRPAPR